MASKIKWPARFLASHQHSQTGKRLIPKCLKNLQRDDHCNFEHFESTQKRTKLRLFGHILRSSPTDPPNQLVFAPGKLVPRPVINTRSDWLTETYSDAYQFLCGCHAVFDIANNDHLQDVMNTAIQRLPPFAGKLALPKGFEPSPDSALGKNTSD